jgi:hypothetical protein
MTTSRSYKVGTGESDGVEQRYLVTTEVSGFDDLPSDCRGLTHYSLDIRPEGSDRWETVSYEGESRESYEDKMSYEYDEVTGEMYEVRYGVYLDMSDPDFKYIVARSTQDIFVEYVQPYFETSKINITMEMRVTLRDGDNNIITGIAFDADSDAVDQFTKVFTFSFIGREEEHKCAASELSVDDTPMRIHYMSFSSSADANEEF